MNLYIFKLKDNKLILSNYEIEKKKKDNISFIIDDIGFEFNKLSWANYQGNAIHPLRQEAEFCESC